MYKHVMNYICPNRNKLVIAISISFFLFTTGSAANAKVVEKCPTSKANQCKAGGQVLAQLINKMDSTNVDYYLWDAKQSKMINGFWHLSFFDSIANQRYIVFTDGKYLVPNVIPAVPGRDVSNMDEKTVNKALKAVIAREKDRRLAIPNRGMATPVNQIPLEQNQMWLGPIDVKKMVAEGSAYLLVKGREKYGAIIIVDDLMSDTVAMFLDDFRNKEKKWEGYTDASIYFVPFFGFMGSQHSSFLGKYFYGMMEAKVPALQAVYNLSRLSPGSKINKNLLRDYCDQMVSSENKPLFNRKTIETPSETIFGKSTAAIRLGIMQSSYYIINGQFNMWSTR